MVGEVAVAGAIEPVAVEAVGTDVPPVGMAPGMLMPEEAGAGAVFRTGVVPEGADPATVTDKPEGAGGAA